MKVKNKELAYELRKQGMPYKEIAELSGYSVDWCKRNLKEVYQGLINDIKADICEDWYGKENNMWPLYIDDIVSGVARLDWYGEREQQIPLSTKKIVHCFLWLDTITAKSISEITSFSLKHSEKYERACRLAYPLLKKSIKNESIRKMTYPTSTIVSESHGKSLNYDK